MKRRCVEPGCRRRAVVGWGQPPRWVCMRHYHAALAAARARVTRAMDARRQLLAEYDDLLDER